MSLPEPAMPAASTAARESEDRASLRSDFLSAIGWMGLGIAILIGSVTMDRLQNQDINPYTIPGLLPGLLGIAMTILGALLAARSWRPHLFASASSAAPANRGEQKRLLLVLGLCLAFGVGLVGHGLPFWLAAAIFVTTTIAALQYPQRRAANQVARGLIIAIVIGLGAGLLITLVFQEFFLVRLP